jgi:hypothetical protein
MLANKKLAAWEHLRIFIQSFAITRVSIGTFLFHFLFPQSHISPIVPSDDLISYSNIFVSGTKCH